MKQDEDTLVALGMDVDMDASLVCEARHEMEFESGDVKSSGVCDIVATYRFRDCTQSLLVCESFRDQTLSAIREYSHCWSCRKKHGECVKFINI